MRESSQSLHDNVNTYFITIPGIARPVSRVALGTWAIGGWMWGGTDEHAAIATLVDALPHQSDVLETTHGADDARNSARIRIVYVFGR